MDKTNELKKTIMTAINALEQVKKGKSVFQPIAVYKSHQKKIGEKMSILEWLYKALNENMITLEEVTCPKCGEKTYALKIHYQKVIKVFFVVKINKVITLIYDYKCGLMKVSISDE
ncbi:MAG: hypothetical protein ACOC1L_04000 [Bacillota bacterium]